MNERCADLTTLNILMLISIKEGDVTKPPTSNSLLAQLVYRGVSNVELKGYNLYYRVEDKHDRLIVLTRNNLEDLLEDFSSKIALEESRLNKLAMGSLGTSSESECIAQYHHYCSARREYSAQCDMLRESVIKYLPKDIVEQDTTEILSSLLKTLPSKWSTEDKLEFIRGRLMDL